MEIDRAARVQIDPEYIAPEPPDADFQGFKQPRHVVYRQYRDYREHGIMPMAGGYNDQPPEWQHDMDWYEIVYSIRAWMIRKEVRERKKQ